MKFNATNFFAFIFVSALFLFSAHSALACSCIAPSPDVPLKMIVTDAHKDAEAVFTATVISVTAPDASQMTDRQIKIKVTKTYKGKISGEMVITTASNSAMCGYDFEVGKSYLIYADGDGNKLSVNNCSRTKLAAIAEAKKDIKILKKLKK